MCGFIAHSSVGRASHGIAEVVGSNPVEALIFSGFVFLFNLLCLFVLVNADFPQDLGRTLVHPKFPAKSKFKFSATICSQ